MSTTKAQPFLRPRKSRVQWFGSLFPWMWLVIAYCVTIATIGLYGRPYIDSDMASDIILADLLNNEGSLLSSNWWYSTELRVVYLQTFYRLALLIFPNNWYAAQVLGQAVWMLLLIVAYVYVGHGLNLKSLGAWGAAALMCPFGTWYLMYGPLGGAYLPHMILVLISFGALLHLLKAKKFKDLNWIVHGILLVCSSIASGLNSVKGVMGYFLPMVLATCTILALQIHLTPTQYPRKAAKLFVLSLVSLILSGIAYAINSCFLSKMYDFSDYNDTAWNTLDINKLISEWSDFLSLFGYPVDSAYGGGCNLFSIEGILSAFGLLIAAAIVISEIRLLQHWKRLDLPQRVVPVLLLMVLLIQGIVFAFAAETSNAYYWLTIVPLVFPVLQLEGESETFNFKYSRVLLAAGFFVCFVCTSISTEIRFFNGGGYRANPHLEEICTWLVDNNYTQGYASFWNGNVITEWSNGNIEMWITEDFHTMAPYNWLQNKAHTSPPDGTVFLLTTDRELETMGLTALLKRSDITYKDLEAQSPAGLYYVLKYDSYQDMLGTVQEVISEQ